MVVNVIEALIGLLGGIWFLFYPNGWFNWTGPKEERRIRKVKKYRFVLIVCIIFCFIGSFFVLFGTFILN